MCPRYSCCVLKYFWDFFTTSEINAMEIGRITQAISVMSGEMLSIMISTPMMVAVDVMICVMLWFSPCPSVSTSLVIRDNTSP